MWFSLSQSIRSRIGGISAAAAIRARRATRAPHIRRPHAWAHTAATTAIRPRPASAHRAASAATSTSSSLPASSASPSASLARQQRHGSLPHRPLSSAPGSAGIPAEPSRRARSRWPAARAHPSCPRCSTSIGASPGASQSYSAPRPPRRTFPRSDPCSRASRKASNVPAFSVPGLGPVVIAAFDVRFGAAATIVPLGAADANGR